MLLWNRQNISLRMQWKVSKEELDQLTKVILEISYNSLYGFTSPQTIKVQGYFKG